MLVVGLANGYAAEPADAAAACAEAGRQRADRGGFTGERPDSAAEPPLSPIANELEGRPGEGTPGELSADGTLPAIHSRPLSGKARRGLGNASPRGSPIESAGPEACKRRRGLAIARHSGGAGGFAAEPADPSGRQRFGSSQDTLPQALTSFSSELRSGWRIACTEGAATLI